jgi:2-phospho-L-lactate/phosphoenolpyruvate guanylyltransferase
MRTLAVVPVKSFSSAKQRLSGVLAAGARRSLAQAMFADVLSALRRAGGVAAIAVVTDDIGAEAIARRDGVTVLGDERRSGQSDAATIGIGYAQAEGFERVALLPGDVPLLDPAELDELLARTERDGIEVAILPDRHGTGTNGLVIAPPDALDPSFGPGSFERHVAAAKHRGVAYRSVELPSLALDVDTADDLATLWSAIAAPRRRAQRTRGALAQLERTGARAKVERSGARVEV